MHDQTRNWWPISSYYWPPGAMRSETIEGFRQAFAACGFREAPHADLVQGIEKVALYAVGSEPTHATRQLPSGHWTSKIGELEDIQHETLEALESEDYGTVALVMQRPISR